LAVICWFEPSSARPPLLVAILHFVTFDIIIVDADWEWISCNTVNLPAVHSNPDVGMWLRMTQLCRQGIDF
jgi:hypothetical protein